MPSRDRPPASTAPAASASASRARWAAEGFSSPRGSTAGQDGEDGIGDGDELPGQTVGRAVRCRTGEDTGVVCEDGEKTADVVLRTCVHFGLGFCACFCACFCLCFYFYFYFCFHVTGLGGEAQVGGVTAEGPGAGVGVTDAEERVALALDQVIGGDTGPVVGCGVQERPACGIGAEEGGVVGRRDGPQVHGFAVGDLDATALGSDDAHEGVGDDFGSDVVRDTHLDDLPGEGVAVTVRSARAEDLAGEIGCGGTRCPLQADVDEPRPGDDDFGDTVRPDEVPLQDLRDTQRRQPGRPRELEGDVGGVVTTATGPGRRDNGPPRYGHAQLPLVDSTTHRAQHGTGELDGGHGTSVWEEGGGYANRFGRGSGMWTRRTRPAGRTPDTARHGRLSAAGAPGPLGLPHAENTPEPRLATIAPAPPTPPPLGQLPHEAHEFGRFEGLGEEGVDADIQPGLDLVRGAGTDDGERKVTGARIGPKPGRGAEPVQAGHDDIEGDDIGPHLMNDIQTLGTVSRGHHLETLQLEIDPDQLPDDLVVVHNKHPTRRAWHNSRVGRDRPPRPGFPHFRPERGWAGCGAVRWGGVRWGGGQATVGATAGGTGAGGHKGGSNGRGHGRTTARWRRGCREG